MALFISFNKMCVVFFYVEENSSWSHVWNQRDAGGVIYRRRLQFIICLRTSIKTKYKLIIWISILQIVSEEPTLLI